MANITPGRTKRRVQTGAPKITAPSDMTSGVAKLQAGVQRGAAEIGRGVQRFAKGVEDLGDSLQARAARVQARRDKVTILEANNKNAAEMNAMVNELKNSGEPDIEKLNQTFKDRTAEIINRNGMGLKGEAQLKYAENSSALTVRYGINWSNWEVDEVNVRQVKALQTQFDNSVKSLQNQPTVEAWLFGVAQTEATIQESNLSPEAKALISQDSLDAHGTASYMGMQPDTAVKRLEKDKQTIAEGRRDAESDIYEAMTVDARDELEKDLVARANAYKQHQKRADVEHDNVLVMEEEDSIYPNPKVARAVTPAGKKAIKKLQKDAGMETKQEVKDQEYLDTSTWIRLHENPADISNPEIVERVSDPADREKFYKIRDSYKGAKLTDVDYKNMLSNLGKDFEAGKFGEGAEGRREYADQLRTFERYVIETPDADPRAYYDRLMDEKNAEYFNDQWFGETVPSPKDLSIAREIEEAGLTKQQGTKRARETWVKAAKTKNPDYTEAELSDYYDKNVVGR